MCYQVPKYNSLKDFLECEELNVSFFIERASFDFKYQYDLKYFIEQLHNLNDIDNDIRRFIFYKNEANYNFDCDGSGEGEQGLICWLSREIYRELWKWKDYHINGIVLTKML